MLKKLDFGAATYLLRKIVPLAEDYYSLVEQLEANGLLAFKVYIDDIESFAKSETELLQHRQATIEYAKEILGDPTHWAYELEDSKNNYRPAYQSLWLPQIRNELCRQEGLDLNSVSVEQRNWAFLASPCERTYNRELAERRLAHRDAQLQKIYELRRHEVHTLLNQPIWGPLHEDDKAGRPFAYLRLGEAFAPLGFFLNAKISTKTTYYFTKELVDDWVICITVLGDFDGRNRGGFKRLADGTKVMNRKNFNFHADLRLKNQKGLHSKKISYLPLEIARASPLRGSDSAWYSDLDELAVAIKNYAILYGLVAERLEGVLIEGLQELV